MKILHPLRTLVVAAAIMAGAAGAYAQEAPGKIEIVGGDTYNWGKVPPGELKGVIEVKNVGEGELKITEVRPSCGCTSAPIDKNVLKPGEIGRISVSLDAKNRSGELVKTLSIISTDVTNPTKVVYLKADIRPVMTFEPVNYFLLNNATVGVETSSAIKITNRSDADFTLMPPTLAQGNVKVRFDLTKRKLLKPGESIDLTVHITPQAAGAINGVVKMMTSTKEYPQVDFNIWGNATAAEVGTSQTVPSTAVQPVATPTNVSPKEGSTPTLQAVPEPAKK